MAQVILKRTTEMNMESFSAISYEAFTEDGDLFFRISLHDESGLNGAFDTTFRACVTQADLLRALEQDRRELNRSIAYANGTLAWINPKET